MAYVPCAQVPVPVYMPRVPLYMRPGARRLPLGLDGSLA